MEKTVTASYQLQLLFSQSIYSIRNIVCFRQAAKFMIVLARSNCGWQSVKSVGCGVLDVVKSVGSNCGWQSVEMLVTLHGSNASSSQQSNLN